MEGRFGEIDYIHNPPSDNMVLEPDKALPVVKSKGRRFCMETAGFELFLAARDEVEKEGNAGIYTNVIPKLIDMRLFLTDGWYLSDHKTYSRNTPDVSEVPKILKLLEIVLGGHDYSPLKFSLPTSLDDTTILNFPRVFINSLLNHEKVETMER